MCGQLKEMRGGDAGGGRAPLDRQSVVARVLGRVRLYLCPFAVCHGEALGRGFVFVQVKQFGAARSCKEESMGGGRGIVLNETAGWNSRGPCGCKEVKEDHV